MGPLCICTRKCDVKFFYESQKIRLEMKSCSERCKATIVIDPRGNDTGLRGSLVAMPGRLRSNGVAGGINPGQY